MANKTVLKPIVKLKIERGQVTPVQKKVCRRFWQKLIAEVKADAKG